MTKIGNGSAAFGSGSFSKTAGHGLAAMELFHALTAIDSGAY